jgi:hypothetical protein
MPTNPVTMRVCAVQVLWIFYGFFMDLWTFLWIFAKISKKVRKIPQAIYP